MLRDGEEPQITHQPDEQPGQRDRAAAPALRPAAFCCVEENLEADATKAIR